MENQSDVLNVKEAAAILRVHPVTLRKRRQFHAAFSLDIWRRWWDTRWHPLFCIGP